jgi:hypothetical protein
MSGDFGSFMDAQLAPDALDKLNEQEKKDKEARLIPQGTYEGVIVEESEPVLQDKATYGDGSANPYYGEPLSRVTVELYNVGDNLANRKLSFNVSSTEKMGKGNKMAGPYKLFLQMAKHTGTKTLREALDAAKNVRLNYRVGVIKAKSEHENPNNFLAAISAVQG